MWQDYVIVAVQLVLIVALVPTLRHPTHKPTLSTSFLNTIPLLILAVTYLTLGLYGSAMAGTILALQWAILGFQRYRLDANSVRTRE